MSDLPCNGRPFPFDVLTDSKGGHAYNRAVEDVKGICSTCPIWRVCIPQNRKEGWVKALLRDQKLRNQRAMPSPITAEQRHAHAAFVRLSKEGIRREQMLPEIVEGERLYQARSYAARKAAA